MNKQINLVTKKEVTKKKIKYLMPAVIVFGVVFGISILFLVINLGFQLQLNGLNNHEHDLVEKFKAQAPKRAKLLVNEEQLAQIHKIVTSRNNLDARLNDLLSVLPPDLPFDQLSSEDQTITLTLSSSNLNTLNTVIESSLQTYAHTASAGVKTINLNTFTTNNDVLNSNGSYAETFEINYK